MKRALLTVLTIFISLKTYASFEGGTIFISGEPLINPTQVTLDQSAIELITPFPDSEIEFTCGGVMTGGLACGFINITKYFSIDIFETNDGDIRLDFVVAGFEFPDISLTGFESDTRKLSTISLVAEEVLDLVNFVDPETNMVIDPQPFGGFGFPNLADVLVFESTESSVSVSAPSPLVYAGSFPGVWNNSFSLLVETAPIPVPAAAWLFLSTLAGLLGARAARS